MGYNKQSPIGISSNNHHNRVSAFFRANMYAHFCMNVSL